MSNPMFPDMSRRNLLKGTGVAVGSLLLGNALLTACSSPGGGPAGPGGKGGTPLNMQLGWLLNSGQMGEAIALQKGYYDDIGLQFKIKQGGPSIDGIALVAAGESQIGQISSSPSLMLARSQGIPIKAFGVGVQEHPYAWISKSDNPIKTPEELIGKTVGGPATSEILFKAFLAANKVDPDKVEYVATGDTIAPLLTGQVDAFGTWLNSKSQRREIGEDFVSMPLAKFGVPLYAYIYYTTDDVLEKNPEIVEHYMEATAKGWTYVRDNIDEAAKAMLEMSPELKLDDIKDDGGALMEYIFNADTKTDGWGTMKKEVWQTQIDLWDELGQFNSAPPKVDDVATWQILDATADVRPKAG
ncbi:MAG: ABC transporter substrate-binding protein [Microbacterium sp.]